MKIGIQTLRLYTNYGGILQAYALQTVLQRMGHEVYVISRSTKLKSRHPLRILLSFIKRSVLRYVKGDKKVFLTEKAQWKHDYPIISQHTQLFIDKYIYELPCKVYSDLPKNSLEVIVVGSDQVWRPQYFGEKIIGDAYLAFARNWNIKRIAYAASFGTDEWEYSEVQTAECKKLISMFDAVSVRESSAVTLCKEHYNVEAQHVLDPTMLLEKEDYIKLIKVINPQKSLGNLLVYILDETPDKQAVIDAVAKSKGLIPFNTKASEGTTLEERIQPPLEQWLRGFIDAEFVITDSFHACVFAIIFNKPFIAYCNKTRGASRFQSLLKMFGLEKRLISLSEELNVCELDRINWNKVDRQLSEFKQASYEYINDCILGNKK